MEFNVVDPVSPVDPVPVTDCEYYDLTRDGHPREPDLDTSIAEIYEKALFASRPTEDYWSYVASLPGSEFNDTDCKSGTRFGFVGEADEHVILPAVEGGGGLGNLGGSKGRAVGG